MSRRNFRYLLLLPMFSVIPLISHAQTPREELMARIHKTELGIHEIEKEQGGLEERLPEIESMAQRQDIEKRIEYLETEKKGLQERLESLHEKLARLEEPRPEPEPGPEPEPHGRKSFVDLFKDPTVLAATITAIGVIVAALIALLRRR